VTRSCARCDWRSTSESPDQPPAAHQAAEHAIDAQHPLCICCTRSLRDQEQQSCALCVGRTRADLADIEMLYALLPAQLGHLTGSAYDRQRPSDDGPALPGGNALVLLAAGSESSVQPDRHGNRDHAADSRPDDAPSASGLLGQWEDDFRSERSEPAASTEATVTNTVAYLMPRIGWAGSHHPAFDEFARDVRRLRTRLEVTTGRSRRSVHAPALCFNCGADALEREWTKAGLAEDWTCHRCHQTYDHARYFLAIRAALEVSQTNAWGLPEHVAATVARPVATVRRWAATGRVGSACEVATRRLVLWWPDVHEVAGTASRRTRRSSVGRDDQSA